MALTRTEYMQEYQARNMAKLVEYNRNYRANHPDQVKQWNKKRRQQPWFKKWSAEYQREWMKAHKKEHCAHAAVARAIASGKLIRPERCEACYVECKPEAHHYKGYEKPNDLDVVWLCKQCHHDCD